MTIIGQNFGSLYTGGYWSRKDVEKKFDAEIKTGQTNKSISYAAKDTIGDTLKYTIQNNVDNFTTKMTFGLKQEFYEEKFCNYQEYIFDCTPCSQKHLKEIIKGYNFRQKSENVYLSSFLDRTEMTIRYKPGNKDCVILTFKYVDLKKKEYKNEYKKLKKKVTE